MTSVAVHSSEKTGALHLNDGQKIALDLLDEWMADDGKQHAALSGAAGTGKTFCVAQWAKDKDDLVFLAPTHKARKVLEWGLIDAGIEDPKCLTIAQALGKQPTLDDNGQEQWSSHGSSLLDNQLVVVDEASMVTADDFLEISDKASKILWIGDKYQLPPINESQSEAFSTGTSYNCELTQQMRYFGHLADICEQIRQAIVNNKPPPPITRGEGIEFLSELGWYHQAIAYFQSRHFHDSSFCRILAFRNKAVEAHNQIVRSFIFANDADEWFQGQKLLCYAPVKRAVKKSKHPKILATNSEELLVIGDPKRYTIGKIDLKYEPPIVKNYLEGLSAIALQVRTETGLEITLRIATPQSKAKIEQTIANIKNQANLSRIDKVCLGVLYRFFDNIKDIFASTVHKAQGSTYKYVLINLADIEACQDIMRGRLLYTAISRASKKVYILHE